MSVLIYFGITFKLLIESEAIFVRTALSECNKRFLVSWNRLDILLDCVSEIDSAEVTVHSKYEARPS